MTRDLAWQRVIDDAIHLCRVLAKWEAAEARKFNSNWDEQPRIPAGNADGGQWTDGGGGEPAAAAAISAAAAVAEGSTDTARARAALQAIGRIAGQARTVASGAAAAIATPASAIAAGILMASATPAGGGAEERSETLPDGTVVTIRRQEDEVHTIVRGESPDGTITFARISVDAEGRPKVLDVAVRPPGGEPRQLDPATMTAASSAVINAATGGGGRKKPTSPDTSGTAATPPPDDDKPGLHGSNNRGRGFGSRPNTPDSRSVQINMDHVVSGHTPNGARAVQSGTKSLFPDTMSPRAIESAVREAYRNASQIGAPQIFAKRKALGFARALTWAYNPYTLQCEGQAHSNGLSVHRRYQVLIRTNPAIFPQILGRFGLPSTWNTTA